MNVHKNARLTPKGRELLIERLARGEHPIDVAEHHGRIVKLMGDGMLVEFASVVDAVHAAVETQQAMTVHNADVPADKRIELRIGINLGDVVIDGDDIWSCPGFVDGYGFAQRGMLWCFLS